jgi:hypothetical protein
MTTNQNMDSGTVAVKLATHANYAQTMERNVANAQKSDFLPECAVRRRAKTASNRMYHTQTQLSSMYRWHRRI